MIKEYLYYYIPSSKAVYRVQPGCCYRQVIFEGDRKSITDISDKMYGELNSEHFQCQICRPELEIKAILKEEYEEKERMVLSFLERHTADFLGRWR